MIKKTIILWVYYTLLLHSLLHNINKKNLKAYAKNEFLPSLGVVKYKIPVCTIGAGQIFTIAHLKIEANNLTVLIVDNLV